MRDQKSRPGRVAAQSVTGLLDWPSRHTELPAKLQDAIAKMPAIGSAHSPVPYYVSWKRRDRAFEGDIARFVREPGKRRFFRCVEPEEQLPGVVTRVMVRRRADAITYDYLDQRGFWVGLPVCVSRVNFPRLIEQAKWRRAA